MKDFLTNQKTNFLTSFFTLILIVFITSCEKESLSEEGPVLNAKAKADKKASDGDSGFQAFHQGFNTNTKAWADKDVSGVLGWCGTIELWNRKNGVVAPSAGNGYATVAWGDCNTFWSEEADEVGLPTFKEGAPATQDPDLWSSSWPENGFLQQLDIYLDPDMFQDGNAFTYANSLKLRSEMVFHYFAVEVTKSDNTLYVDGYPVSGAGWYTFTYLFGDESGDLTVDFVLTRNNNWMYSSSIDGMLYSEDPTSSLHVDHLGSGYIWFVSLQEGVELPIDEQYLRPGNMGNRAK